MKKIIAAILLCLVCAMPALAASKDSELTLNKSLTLVGSGLLGVVLASGAIGLVSAGSMMIEGTGFADALESGAGLALPVALLSGVLGIVFGQEMVGRNVDTLVGEFK